MRIVLLLLVLACGPVWAEDDPYAQGREIAFDRNKGNCLACHMIAGGELPGNSAPPLVAMAQRFPDRELLRQQIWDAAQRNPETVMPPYGRHRIVTEEEFELMLDFIHSL